MGSPYVVGVALAPAAFASHAGLRVGDSQPSGRSTPMRGFGSARDAEYAAYAAVTPRFVPRRRTPPR